MLYLNVDGLTNLAIAEGKICRFTRVVGSGLEGMASELAERRSIALAEARELLSSVDLSQPAPVAQGANLAPAEEPGETLQAPQLPDGEAVLEQTADEAEQPEQPAAEYGDESEMSYEEMTAVESQPQAQGPSSDADLRTVLENGIRDISGEVRNSLDFHRSQEGGGEVSHVVLSGSVRDIPGFAEALQASLGVEVRCQELAVGEGQLESNVSPHRLAVATGLAATEAPQ